VPENAQDDWQLSIFIPEGEVAVAEEIDPMQNHAIREIIPGLRRVAKVRAAEVQEQWTRTVDTLMKLSSTIADRSKDWSIEEIEVGLTLSAKGELLFIAEAGAEASIKFTLKRRPVVTTQMA
jgi:hypothetical protein